jgi:carotenoid cleavage dioxygenase-like enzyme
MVQRFSDRHFAADFFTTLRFEGEIRDCEVEGEIPSDMYGTFYRLGGDWAYPPKFPHDPPFSADGYISMFRFANGRVDYKGKFVRTPRFLANQKAGEQLFGIYRNRMSDDPAAKGVNGTVANTTPVVHAGKLFATKEDGRPFEIDPHTLETKGEWDFYGKYQSLTFTAHPKIDPISGEMICFGYEAAGELSDDVFMYVVDKAGHITREVRLKMPYVSMLHDIAISRDHIVLPVYGLATDKEWMEGNNPHWAWNSKLPGYVAVLPRNGEAKDVRWFKGPSKAMIHTLNANVEGNKLILDAPVSDGNPFPFFADRHGAPWNPMEGMTTIRRWTFDLAGKHDGWEEENLFPQAPGALSRIDDRFASLPYRYSYMGYHDPTKPFDVPRPADAPPTFPVTNCIGRFDMRALKMDSFFVGSVGTAQEACFVPKHQKAAEGDGYLVSVYSNFIEKRSELVIIDATTLEQRARVILPFKISEQVHGVWASHEELPF